MQMTQAQNNVGQAKRQPTTASEMVYAIITDACRRWLEGSIKEHKSYQFYTGSSIHVFITLEQYRKLQSMCDAGSDETGDLVVNGKYLGSWKACYFHKKLSCRLILTFSKDFEQVYSVVKRFAQLAAKPLLPTTPLHYCCSCKFPMVTQIDGQWKCEDCWVKEEDLPLF